MSTIERTCRRTAALLVAAGVLAGCSTPSLLSSKSFNRGSMSDSTEVEAEDSGIKQASAEIAVPATKVADLLNAGDLAIEEDKVKARSSYEAALTLDPTNSKAHHRLGVIADVEARYADAERHYQAAIAGDPRNAAILSDLGYSYILQRRFAEAEKRLKQARATEPGNMMAAANLALVYAYQDDREKCIALARLLDPEVNAETKAAELYARAGVPFLTESAALANARPIEIPDDFDATESGEAPITEPAMTEEPADADPFDVSNIEDSAATEPNEASLPIIEAGKPADSGPTSLLDEVLAGSTMPVTDAASPQHGGHVAPTDFSPGTSRGDRDERRNAAIIGMHTGLGGLFGRYTVSGGTPTNQGQPSPPAIQPRDIVESPPYPGIDEAKASPPPFTGVVPAPAGGTPGLVDPPPYPHATGTPHRSAATPRPTQVQQPVAPPPWTGTVPSSQPPTPNYGGRPAIPQNGFVPGPAVEFGTTLPVVRPKR